MTSTKYFSSKQENAIAKYLDWSVVSGSGSRQCCPGDIESSGWLGECKTHEKSGHRIVFQKSVWSKIAVEAMSKFKLPALFTDDGSQDINHTWCMIPQNCILSGVIFNELPEICINKSTISFCHEDLLSQYNQISKSHTKPCVYSAQIYLKSELAIMPLRTFHRLFEEGILC